VNFASSPGFQVWESGSDTPEKQPPASVLLLHSELTLLPNGAADAAVRYNASRVLYFHGVDAEYGEPVSTKIARVEFVRAKS
jgi:hypothetical protein